MSNKRRYSTNENQQYEQVIGIYCRNLDVTVEKLPPILNREESSRIFDLFTYNTAQNAPTINRFKKTYWTKQMGIGRHVREPMEKIIDIICTYQRSRHERNPFRRGHEGDPTNLVLEEFKE